MDSAIRIHNVSKKYRLGESRRYATIADQITRLFRRDRGAAKARSEANGDAVDEIWALKNVSIDVSQGEVVGIIGRNGSGKSTLLKILSRITEPSAGEILLHGRVSSLLGVGPGFHPELTGRDNIYLNGSILGMRKAEIDRKFEEIVQFSGVAKFLDTSVKHYSSGMQVRLAFAVAAHLEPDILIVDEVLAVGDAEFQRKCVGKMNEVAGRGRTVLFVSHNMAAVESFCTRTIVLDYGRLDYDGQTNEAIAHYLHRSSVGGGRVEIDADREGQRTGVALRAVSTIDSAGKIAQSFKTGEDVEVRLEFRLEEWAPLKKLQIAIFLEDANGFLISKCYSEHQSRTPLIIQSEGIASCIIKSLRLVPGQYSIGVLVRDGQESICKHERILTFELEQADLFGTGKLPGPPRGMLLPDVRWKCEEKRIA
jgi:lipopolysaccharide transport system ATP-binding protein